MRPILITRSKDWNSQKAGKFKGGLALDSRDVLPKGCDTGPGLVAGDPENRLIDDAVRYKLHDLQMPPQKAIPAAEVKSLGEWVRMGAF